MDNWKVTIPCTLAEAQAVTEAEDIDEAAFGSPSLVASEVDAYADPQMPGSWAIHGYFTQKPDARWVRRLRDLVPSADGLRLKPERLPEDDWVTMSQSGLEPIRAGRFCVHTPEMPASTEAGITNFCIPASLAFGTGHHNTTRGCLMMLDAMKRRGHVVRSHIDIGTGTGLLAFAAMHLWPRSFATASDIDSVCGPAIVDNAEANGVALGQRPGALAMFIAEGLDDADLQRRAPYDLVIANILAGPLIELAGDIAAVTAPQGQAVLSGLLGTQADAVSRAYRMVGFRLAERLDLGDWTVLRLRKRGGRWTGKA
ncbi:50S ribosomal protein L11 methyltransferase [Blastomonas fulva]|uniref:50S ribosomal protein L11 methyltransferase n=1 Tax=Blastomonas fulva TaxID=1550728 RepID=UPI0025A3E2D1|nr:50S ribosomal protein L11 methyltransferase [Blastomonas fulva]MDM7927319.1 50S ribosomal protein L11 methyltransferase [Blastomonas fulva]MDM7967749.1 50S ribosomal protein L11 methyltransferase [Blastomonas fulva]